MAINHLTNKEFERPLNSYHDTLERSEKVGGLTEVIRETALRVQHPSLMPVSPTLPAGNLPPQRQFEEVERVVIPLVKEIRQQEQTIESLGSQIGSTEQQLAAAQKLDNAKRIKLILTVIGILFFLFLLSQCMG